MIKNNSFHFSVDDVFNSLIEISDKKILLKHHWFFKQLYHLWKIHGVRTSCNLFFEGIINGRKRNLQEVRCIKNEIKEGWLFFGPHALNLSTPPFKQNKSQQIKTFNNIYNEIDRFAGFKNRCTYIRLHYYSESYQLSNYWKQNKIKGLFSTDRSVGSHTMPKYVSKKLINFGNAEYKSTVFIKTDFRVEWLSKIRRNINSDILNAIKLRLKAKKFIIIYSHEYELKKKKNKKALIKCITLIKKINFKSMHP